MTDNLEIMRVLRIIAITIGLIGLIGLLVWGNEQDEEHAKYLHLHPHPDIIGTVIDIRSNVKPGNPVAGAIVGYVFFGPLGALVGSSDEDDVFCKLTVRQPDGSSHFYTFASRHGESQLRECLLSKEGDQIIMRWSAYTEDYRIAEIHPETLRK